MDAEEYWFEDTFTDGPSDGKISSRSIAEKHEDWPSRNEEAEQRLLQAHAHAKRVLEQATESQHAVSLARAALRAPTVDQRVIWLRRAASAWAEPLLARSACAQGCSHCCHIAVSLTDIEARVIGKAIRRRVHLPVGAPNSEQVLQGAVLPGAPDADAGYTAPCPFLVESRCSIYESRPPACRSHLNLDQDDFLCRLRSDRVVAAPYADASELKSLYVLAQPNARWADIRAYFPVDGSNEGSRP